MLREVRPTLRISAKRLTSSPTNTGEWNTMLSAATVAQRPRARRGAGVAAPRILLGLNPPPEKSPAGVGVGRLGAGGGARFPVRVFSFFRLSRFSPLPRGGIFDL